MVLTSAGVVSSESRIVAESHSENIAVNELLGWTLLLQRAICLEPGGDTHYHEAEERAGCNVAPPPYSPIAPCYSLAPYECCPNYPVFWHWHLVDLLTLTSAHNLSWPAPQYISCLQLNIISHDDLEAVTCSNHQQLSSSVTACRPRLCPVLPNIFILLMRSDATQRVKTQGILHISPRVCLARSFACQQELGWYCSSDEF